MQDKAVSTLPTPAASVRFGQARWAISAVLLSVVVIGFFDRISIAVLFTDTDFQSAMGTGFNPARLGLLMTGFLFAYGISGLLLGFLGDKMGPRRGLLIGGALWGGLMLLIGNLSSYTSVLTSRVALGIAEGPQFSFANRLIKNWFPSGERGRANAIWLMGSPLGSAIGFPLTVSLVAFGGWRASFLGLGLLNLVVMVPLIFFVVRDWPAGAQAVAQHEERSAPPFFKAVQLFLGDWRFWLIVIFNSSALLYLWGLNSWLPSYLLRVRGFDLKSLGFFASLPFVLMFCGELLGGLVSDRLGRRAAVCCAGLFGAGLFVLIVPQVAEPHLAAVLIAISAGFWGMSLPPLFAMAMDIIPPSVTATGVGVFNGIGNLVGACSPLLMGWIIGSSGSFDAGLMVLVVAGLVGACAMLPLLRRH